LDLRKRRWQANEENCMLKSSIICALRQVFNPVKENEMGWVCGINGEEMRSVYREQIREFGRKIRRKGAYS
jgi:hypothetical protein